MFYVILHSIFHMALHRAVGHYYNNNKTIIPQ